MIYFMCVGIFLNCVLNMHAHDNTFFFYKRGFCVFAPRSLVLRGVVVVVVIVVVLEAFQTSIVVQGREHVCLALLASWKTWREKTTLKWPFTENKKISFLYSCSGIGFLIHHDFNAF